MPPDSREFAVLVDQWLEGRLRTEAAPGWSVIRNVLHWVK